MKQLKTIEIESINNGEETPIFFVKKDKNGKMKVINKVIVKELKMVKLWQHSKD